MANDAGWRANARQRIRRRPPISLVRLLAVFLKIGCIGFGGGMAVIALMEREFVQKRRLLSGEEFLHGVGLGQVLGSFAANAAFFIGYRLFGVAGGILSTGVFMMPSLALVIALAHFYFRYHSIPTLQAAVVGGRWDGRFCGHLSPCVSPGRRWRPGR